MYGIEELTEFLIVFIKNIKNDNFNILNDTKLEAINRRVRSGHCITPDPGVAGSNLISGEIF